MTRFGSPVPGAVVLALLVVGVGCQSSSRDEQVPESLCGTKVDRGLTEALLQPDGRVTERNEVDLRNPQPSSWCQAFVDGKGVLSLRFAWHPDAVDPFDIASSGDSVSRIGQPARVKAAYETTVGNNGAVATARCRTRIGSYFTLSALLADSDPVDRSHRADIENFMRAYFPATLATLGCVTSAT
ncbi:hypothetical protein ACF1GY_12340 [Streptomyces sp. NPDC014684]|uniref:hypothetical protein n=1 Tax=Streptomyces sp. NPDC014684 TaxID=3364880 RepID=UPI0036F6A1CD